jgi:hypothetical protein
LPVYSLSKAWFIYLLQCVVRNEVDEHLVSILVLFASMTGLHNAEEMDLYEACSKSRFQSGEEMDFVPAWALARSFYTSRLSTKMTRFNCPVLESLFKCVE